MTETRKTESTRVVLFNAVVALYPHFYNKHLREDMAKKQALEVVRDLWELVEKEF